MPRRRTSGAGASSRSGGVRDERRTALGRTGGQGRHERQRQGAGALGRAARADESRHTRDRVAGGPAAGHSEPAPDVWDPRDHARRRLSSAPADRARDPRGGQPETDRRGPGWCGAAFPREDVMPVGKYPTFAACVADNQDKENPQAYCGSLEAATQKSEQRGALGKILEGLAKFFSPEDPNRELAEELTKGVETLADGVEKLVATGDRIAVVKQVAIAKVDVERRLVYGVVY